MDSSMRDGLTVLKAKVQLLFCLQAAELKEGRFGRGLSKSQSKD